MPPLITATSLASGGLFTTTTTNGANQSTSKTTDASGKVVQSNDNGGQLDFPLMIAGEISRKLNLVIPA
ncbi:MAG: hypothetical protein WKF59_11465 [Chitinophagaceae bacterium]